MSLTSLLAARHGPVREFFEEQLPELKAFRDRWRACGPPTILAAGENPPYGILGAALDYRFRYFFQVTDPRTFVAAAGFIGYMESDAGAANAAEALMARSRGEDAYGNLATAITELTTRASPVGRVLDGQDERTLARFCCLLAMHEAVFRIGLLPTSPLAELPHDASVEAQLAVVDEAWVDDVVALAQGAMDSASHLFDQPAILNPTFAGSGDVGGADADLIVNNTLLEIKTTKNPPQRPYLYQAIGYVLLDYDDAFEIDGLGFYLARVPALITWPLDELLAELAGRPVDRAELRDQFRSAVAATK